MRAVIGVPPILKDDDFLSMLKNWIVIGPTGSTVFIKK